MTGRELLFSALRLWVAKRLHFTALRLQVLSNLIVPKERGDW